MLPAEGQECRKVAKEAEWLHAAPEQKRGKIPEGRGNKNSCCQFIDSSFMSLVVFNPRDNLTQCYLPAAPSSTLTFTGTAS